MSNDGKGLRYNKDKIPYDFLPLSIIYKWVKEHRVSSPCYTDDFLTLFGKFQSGDDDALDKCIHLLIGTTSLESFGGAAQVFQHVTLREVSPYPTWNWLRGMPWSVPIGCVVRHYLASKISSLDAETNLPHTNHILCNLVMLLVYRTVYPEGDDRPKGLL